MEKHDTIKNNKKKTLQEIKNTLLEKENYEPDCISLYDVLKAFIKKKKDYTDLIDKYNCEFDYMLCSQFINVSDVKFFCFDYLLNNLIIKVKGLTDSEKIFINKNNDELIVVNNDSIYAEDVLKVLGDEISVFYDELKKYGPFFEEKKEKVKSTNSNFAVDISNYCISLYNYDENNFKVTIYNGMNDYIINCNSQSVIDYIIGKESKLLSKIYIKIEDCPKWCIPLLYELRQDQVKEKNNDSGTKQLKKSIFNSRK